MLMEDNDHSTEPYLQILFEETDLCGDGTLVIYDTLHWTVKQGSNKEYPSSYTIFNQ